MYSEQENDKYRKFAKLFAEAELLEKELEIEVSSYFQPSINELRYAGKHISIYLVTHEQNDYEKAISHVLRAVYDARDMLMLLYLEKINDFEIMPNISSAQENNKRIVLKSMREEDCIL